MRQFVSSKHLSLLALLVLAEYTFSTYFLPWRGRVEFLYLAVLDYAFFWNWERTPFFAAVVGLVHDSFGGHLFGIQTVSLALTGWFISIGMQKLERDLWVIRLGLTLLFILLTGSLSSLLGLWLEAPTVRIGAMFGTLLQTALFTTAFSPLFFGFTAWWFKRGRALRQYELFR